MPISAHLARVLIKDNPWLDGGDVGTWLGRFVPKRYLPRQSVLRAGTKACLVVGPRQAGKSTLIWKTLADAGEPCVFLNCEEPSVAEWLRSPAEFLTDLETIAPAAPAILFEEVQRLREAGLFLKGLVDRRPGKRLYATGSSSFELEGRTRESLAGRAERHLLLPLSLTEIGATVTGSLRIREDKLRAAADAQVIFGGYPSVVLAAEPERVLAELVEAFVLRDASDRFAVRNAGAFRRLLELAASQVGNLCNVSEWAGIAGVSHETAGGYLDLLQDAHVLRLVRPFVGGKRAEITSAAKVFFIDNGIRNQLFGGFGAPTQRADQGALVENLVFTELAKVTNPLLDGIHYWRSKSGAEVDFVVRHQGRLAGVEVKTGDAGARLARSARSFIEAYGPELFVVVNRESYPPRREGKTEVSFVRPWEIGPVIAQFVGTA
jgi:predicted AAA+ superfamily ATPase